MCDVECNIWDMSSNEMEWTTETSNFSVKPCILRGGFVNSNLWDLMQEQGEFFKIEPLK